MFGNWVTRIPNVKDSLALTEADLGLALLGAPIGALCIMPLAGWIIAQAGLGKTTFWSTLIHAISLLGLAFANSFWLLTGALWFYGLSNSVMDISMNATAAQVERSARRAIMSTCHGMWSIGAVIGSVTGSFFVGGESEVHFHLVLITSIVILIILILAPKIFSYQEAKQIGEKVFAFPRGTLLVLAVMAFCILMSEGAIADWSAVYMKDTLLANPFLTGIAYAGFSFLMALGRFLGDAVIPKFGRGAILKWGGAVSAIGLLIALVFGQPFVAIIGFSITGLGYSCLVPVLFIAAANQPGYTSGTGIAAVTTVGYSGFLIGPPLIGFLAEAYNLSIGLSFVMVCSALVTVLAMVTKFK
ncbi:MAG: MFS transporter [Cyclobacteriaceae bacterium]|nr:MFS transporter [Cyclobacteriaceae bacterium HetDA_MAG_MS6]